MAEVALDRGYNQIVAASAKLIGQIDSAENAEQLGAYCIKATNASITRWIVNRNPCGRPGI